MRPIDRLVAAFLLLMVAAGSLALWIVVPAGSLWTLLQLSDSKTYHLFVGLFGVPTAMILFTPLLFWLTTCGSPAIGDTTRRSTARGACGAPLEPFLLWSLVIAFVVLSFWFFFLADGPSRITI